LCCRLFSLVCSGVALSGKSWDDIIPEGERQKIDDEELHQQLIELNPPPRSRKTVSKSTVSYSSLLIVIHTPLVTWEVTALL